MRWLTILSGQIILFLTTSCKESIKPYLDETFEKNSIGWIEELSDNHEIEIKDGKYVIFCKDTSARQTSAFPLDDSFLIGLPKSYEIDITAKFLGGNNDNELGLILGSATIQYRLGVKYNGQVEISIYNGESENIICSEVARNVKFNQGDYAYIRLLVSGRDFKLLLNDKLLCDGQFNVMQWLDFRLFVGQMTKAEFYELKIKDIEVGDVTAHDKNVSAMVL